MTLSRSPSSLVSAIVIFLNEENFLEDAIISVLRQTYDHWELLLVDDGSTDQSTVIAQQYARQLPGKVKYLEHPGHQNRGKNASRNLGLTHAQGDYIAFLDGDDVWLPKKLEQQVAIFANYPDAAMVYGRTQIWYSWTGKAEDQNRDYFYPLGIKPNMLIQPPTLLIKLLQNTSQSPTTCNAILRRSVFNQIGFFDDSFQGMYEDLLFFAQVQLHLPIFVADVYWARYRRHPNSCTAFLENLVTHTDQYCIYRRSFLTWVKQYLIDQNVKNLSLWFFLQRDHCLMHYPRLLKWLIITKYTNQKLINKVISKLGSLFKSFEVL